MNPDALKSESDYELACNQVYKLIETGVEYGTKEFDQLKQLSLLVENYEKENHPL